MVLVFMLISGNRAHAIYESHRYSSLPGGLLSPQFAAAAFTNAAALTTDWYTEFQALYSPPGADGASPHSYLVGYATSNLKYGFNVGYLGSTESNVSIHNIFSGVSFRYKKQSFGIAVRKNDVAYSINTPIDLSWNWSMTSKFQIGVVGYDLLEDQIMAFGLLYSHNRLFTLEADFQLPFPGYPELATHEYSANFASVLYLGRFGLSLGTRYQKWSLSDSVSFKWRTTLGTTFKIKGKFSAIALYSNAPDTYTIGLCWGSPPTSKQWIDLWLERDRAYLN